MTSDKREYWLRTAIGGAGIDDGGRYIHLGRDKYLDRLPDKEGFMQIVFRVDGKMHGFKDITWPEKTLNK